MKLIFKLSFCLMLFIGNSYTLSAQTTDALIIDDKGNVNVPNGNVTATGNMNTTNGKLQEDGKALVPKGVIVMWYGDIATVPAGWAVCDGKNGTPNLSGRFVVAAGSNGETTYKNGDSSGVDKPKLTVAQLPAHTHNIDLPTITDGQHSHWYNDEYIEYKGTNHPKIDGNPDGNKGTLDRRRTTDLDGSHKHKVEGKTVETGNGQPFDNRPRYYALYYIMKL